MNKFITSVFLLVGLFASAQDIKCGQTVEEINKILDGDKITPMEDVPGIYHRAYYHRFEYYEFEDGKLVSLEYEYDTHSAEEEIEYKLVLNCKQ